MNQSSAEPGAFAQPFGHTNVAGAMQRAWDRNTAEQNLQTNRLWGNMLREPAPGSFTAPKGPARTSEQAHPQTGSYAPTDADRGMLNPDEQVRDITPNYQDLTSRQIYRGDDPTNFGRDGKVIPTFSDNYQGATTRGLDRDIQQHGVTAGGYTQRGGNPEAFNDFVSRQQNRTPEARIAAAWEQAKQAYSQPRYDGTRLPTPTEAYNHFWNRDNPNSAMSLALQGREREAALREDYAKRFGGPAPQAAPTPPPSATNAPQAATGVPRGIEFQGTRLGQPPASFSLADLPRGASAYTFQIPAPPAYDTRPYESVIRGSNSNDGVFDFSQGTFYPPPLKAPASPPAPALSPASPPASLPAEKLADIKVATGKAPRNANTGDPEQPSRILQWLRSMFEASTTEPTITDLLRSSGHAQEQPAGSYYENLSPLPQ